MIRKRKNVYIIIAITKIQNHIGKTVLERLPNPKSL